MVNEHDAAPSPTPAGEGLIERLRELLAKFPLPLTATGSIYENMAASIAPLDMDAGPTLAHCPDYQTARGLVEVINALPQLLASTPATGEDGARERAIREAAAVVESLAAEGDARERRMAGWDDPAVEHPRGWSNLKGDGQREAAAAILALLEKSR